MIATRYYPLLTSVLKVDSLPDELSFIEGGLENLLDDIFVKDYQIVKSRSGDSISYYLTLKIYKRLGIEIPGAFSLLLNPPRPGDPDPLSSEIPVSVQVQAEILKYVSNFDILSFSSDPMAFLNLFLELLGMTLPELIDDLVQAFTNTNSIGEITAIINQANSLVGTVDEIPSPATGSRESQINSLIAYVEAGSGGLSVVGAVYGVLSDTPSTDEIMERLNRLFQRRMGGSPVERLKKLFKPKINASIKLCPVIEFPRNVLVPIKPDDTIEEDPLIKSRLEFDIDEFTFSTEGGIGFDKDISVGFSPEYPKAQVGNTGLTIGFQNAKLDLSEETNIAEATADGRPNTFRGVYIEQASIGLPPFVKDDPDNPVPIGVEIVGRNLLIGTGGLSGTIGLETTGPGLCKTFGDKLKARFDSFDITFHQNSIIESNIKGTIILPGFEDASGGPVEINIDVHIGEDGDFRVTASEEQGISAIKIKDVLAIELNSIFVGREDGRWFFGLSGAVNFEDLGGAIGNFLPDKIEIKKLLVWEDGKIEIEGGKLTLPKAVSLKIGPAELSITAIGLGSHEQEHDNSITHQPELRQYKYFTFDGGISVNPGGVDASGNGITLFFTTDNNSGAGRDLHFFMRIQSISIDIIIPGSAKPKDATLLLSGFLAMKDTPNGTEYQGGVSFTLPKLKMGGSAAMRLNPKVPAFIIDVGLELSTPIVLGATGLGIYGFRGLVGQRYVSTKHAAGVDDSEPWWKYYKAKIAPDYKEGIQVSKFDQTDGFSLGAGISLATASDGGKAFSSKIFFLLSLPEVFLLQGQGQILKERIGLDTTQDPPFFALIAITSQSIETAFGVNYKVPDDGDDPGSIATVDGVMEMGFFWGNSGAWYINIGKDQPENRRIQVRLLELFNAYFYFMLSSNGIRAGAGASFEIVKKFGPLKAELSAYLDVAGRISRRPKEIGGSIQLGGAVELSIFGFGFRIGAAASLAAESAKPFIVSGSVEVCVRVLKKDRCAKFNFTWTFRDELDTSETPLLKALLSDSVKALNIQTSETFELWTGTSLPSNPLTQLQSHIVPVDSFIDIEFLHGVLPAASVLGQFGGNTMGSNYIEYVPPQRGKSDRVKHEYQLTNVEILYYNGSSWQPFDVFAANTPLSLATFVTTDLSTLKDGFWQYQAPDLHNKLRVLAQSPLAYVSQGSGGIVPEDLGITTQEIFCPPVPRDKQCANFEVFVVPQNPGAVIVPADEPIWHQYFVLRVTGLNGKIVNRPWFSLNKALRFDAGSTLDISFPEPKPWIQVKMRTLTDESNIHFYQRVKVPKLPGDPVEPEYTFQLIATHHVAPTDSGVVPYIDPEVPIDRIVIDAGTCSVSGPLCAEPVTPTGYRLQELLFILARNGRLTLLTSLATMPYSGIFIHPTLYTPTCEQPQPRWVPILITPTTLIVNLLDNCGYSCRVELYAISTVTGFSFGELAAFINMRPDPAYYVEGPNKHFLIDGVDHNGNIFPLRGYSCFTVINCEDTCSAFLYSLCSMNLEDYLFNETLPTTFSVQEEVDTIINSFNGSLQPIWRPDTNYAIRVTLKDKLNREGGSFLTEYNNTAVFGFRTMGPIGHFHIYRDDSETDHELPAYHALELEHKEDEFKLKDLHHYIDFQKCFPNADGQLINAKPLFYVDPKLLLYFTRNHVYQMLNGWDAWGGLEALQADFTVTIYDPATEEDTLPEMGVLSWSLSSLPVISEDITILNNMMTFGDPCAITTIIDPQYPVSNFALPTLKPSKLYTAVFNLSYKRNSESEFVTRELWRYPFQTSQYSTFEEQVQSWKLQGDAKTGMATNDAVFIIDRGFDAVNDIAVAISILNDTMPKDDLLRQSFGDPFNRIIDGALKLESIHTPVSTEFNIIRNSTTGNVIGVLVKNPEPFNDPKIPKATIEDSVSMVASGGGTFMPVYSKDYSSVLFTNATMNMGIADGDELQFTFTYKQSDGVSYQVVGNEVVIFNVSI
jgi:hypothetical protein